jgi:hypothetical protein
LALLLLPYLEAAPSDDLELPSGFLQQLAQQFEDEGLSVVRVASFRPSASAHTTRDRSRTLVIQPASTTQTFQPWCAVMAVQILDPILSRVREEAAKKTLLDPFLQHLRALAVLAQVKPIAKVVRLRSRVSPFTSYNVTARVGSHARLSESCSRSLACPTGSLWWGESTGGTSSSAPTSDPSSTSRASPKTYAHLPCL